MTTTELSGGAAAESSVPVLAAKSLTKHFPVRRTRLGDHGPAVHAVDDVTGPGPTWRRRWSPR